MTTRPDELDDVRPDPWSGDDEPTPDALHAYLTTDPDGTPVGHLTTPDAPYAYDLDDAAWYAVALFYVVDNACGYDDPPAGLDDALRLVVQGHADVLDLVGRDAYAVPPDVLDQLDADAVAWRGRDADACRDAACRSLDLLVGPPVGPYAVVDHDVDADDVTSWADLVELAHHDADHLAPVVAYAVDEQANIGATVADAACAVGVLLDLVAAIARPAATGVVPLPGFPLYPYAR